MAAPERILELVERFGENLGEYRAGSYNETRARVEFVNPFFEELGWDVSDRRGAGPGKRDVVHEDTLRVEGPGAAGEGAKRRLERPDYSFWVGNERKFYVEAKKPAVNVEQGVNPAYQVRSYGWSAKLPVSILTDFEELAVYDCRLQPADGDPAQMARVRYYRYDEYAEKWGEIAELFSREAVRDGSLDRFIETVKPQKGSVTVDAAFLKEISLWRELLARDFATRNPGLTQRDLNYAVQMTINRIIFLRIAEDRGTELYGDLMDTTKRPAETSFREGYVYRALVGLFQRADYRYNSGLFHFTEERGRSEVAESFTLDLAVGDETLAGIIERLYPPKSPYKFDVIPIEILGQVYEQFLGKVIRLAPAAADDGRRTAEDEGSGVRGQGSVGDDGVVEAGREVVIEDKPEVRKAGGVYYTPGYIVDYIVKQTVGKLVEGKTPKEVAGLRILDPACGSGSFLIGAYGFLLDWHLKWYLEDAGQKHKKELVEGEGGVVRLSVWERKRILLNNIYGVDIDQQAVEVTKLSLLLKVLEGEKAFGGQIGLYQERVLPDLGSNIKWGNSLIGPDFYESGQASFLDSEERYRINVFDWEKEFPAIMGAGGFDAVIGNPPYGAWFQATEASYFSEHYEVFRGVKDVYTFFIEKGLSLLRHFGKLSYIVPSAWLGGPDYTRLRALLLRHTVSGIVLLPFDVFADAYVDTTIVVLSKEVTEPEHTVQTHVFKKREKLARIDLNDTQYKQVKQHGWLATQDHKFVLDPETMYLLQRLRTSLTRTLADVISIKRGVLFDKSLLTSTRETDQSYLYFEGDVYRYNMNVVTDRWVEFGDKMKERPKEFSWFEGERILLRRLVNRRQRLMATLTDETFITNKNLYSVRPRGGDIEIRVLLAALNSRLLSFLYIKQVTQAVKDDFPQVTIKDVLSLPFPSATTIAGVQPRMVRLVEMMLGLHKELAGARTPMDKRGIERQIEATDGQIDRLVYELYGLTEEEVGIVGGKG